MEINPYLLFGGNCAEALARYAEIFGGEVVSSATHGDSPMADKVPADWKDKILHARVQLGGGQVLMASDSPPDWYETPQGFSVSVTLDDPAEAGRIFDALAEGGTVKMAYGPTFWAKGFGMLTDRFGVPWMVSGGGPA